jgi:hypothetical protein
MPAPVVTSIREETPSDEEQDELDDPAPDEEEAAITWTTPDSWPEVPNASTMRIATRRVPHTPGDAEDADLSISRAGGGLEANVSRWIGQFAAGSAEQRTEKTVHGMPVTVLSIEGSFADAVGGEDAEVRADWALLGAIVQGDGQPYFFKLTGPRATVRAARRSFVEMIESVRRVAH